MEHFRKEIFSDTLMKSINEKKVRLVRSNPDLYLLVGSKALGRFETILKVSFNYLETQNTVKSKTARRDKPSFKMLSS